MCQKRAKSDGRAKDSDGKAEKAPCLSNSEPLISCARDTTGKSLESKRESRCFARTARSQHMLCFAASCGAGQPVAEGARDAQIGLSQSSTHVPPSWVSGGRRPGSTALSVKASSSLGARCPLINAPLGPHRKSLKSSLLASHRGHIRNTACWCRVDASGSLSVSLV